MTKIINPYDGARLYELDQFHKMLSDDYLSDEDNIQTKFIFKQFFKDDDDKSKEKMALLNISYSLPSLIVEKFSDYVGEPNLPFEVELDAFVSSFIWGGDAIFRPRVVDREFVIDCVIPSEYVLNDDGSERVLYFYQIVDSNNVVQNYIFEEYYLRNQVTRFLYHVSKLQKFQDYTIEGQLVPLTTLPQTAALPQFETLPGITYSPLVVVHNRILKGRKYGTSEIRKVRSLISSIEIEAVNIQDQFLKHLRAKLALPISAMNVGTDGKVNVKDLEAYGMESGDTLPAYIRNDNPLIDKSFDQIEGFLRQICAVLTIPTEFMGLKDGGAAESADTKKIRLVSFIKKVEKIRDKFDEAFVKLAEIKKAWVGLDNTNPSAKGDEPITISWPSIFPDDPQVLATELQTAQDARLISNLKAIMRFQNLSEEEALKEQEIINKEKASIDTAMTNVPPATFPN